MIGIPALAAVMTLIGLLCAMLMMQRGESGPESAGSPWTDARDRDALARALPTTMRHTLSSAGIGDPRGQVTFVTLHGLIMLSGAAVAARLATDLHPSGVAAVMAALVGAGLGWWLPRAWLEGRRARRRAEIVAQFPVMLDLLQISLQGGMSLPAAWSGVARSLQSDGNPLAEEMRRVDVEMSLGGRWHGCLATASDRSGVAQFRELGSLLKQTDRFGTEVSGMMRSLADSIRHDDLQSLEERAHTASVKMLFPLAMFLLPASAILIIVPLLLLLLNALSKTAAD
jgi:pilus assembly protein TadC